MSAEATSWVEIDRAALKANLAVFRRAVGPSTRVCAVIKSNAYGHDMVLVARVLRHERLWGFGVADLAEALTLRHAGIRNPLLVMSSFAAADVRAGIAANIAFTIFGDDQARLLQRRAGHRTITIHLKVDTGTTRLGLTPDEAARFARRLNRYPALRLAGVMSHFANAEGVSPTFTRQQIRAFENALATIPQKNILRHISCSASALRYPESRYDLVRVGIGLYGIWPSAATRSDVARRHPGWKLRPALTWLTRLLQVRRVARGTNIGYGRTFTTRRAMTIGTIPVGYWDGLRRSLSNQGPVLVNGISCRVIGRVCMNLTMIDCSRVSRPAAGDTVVLLGGADAPISADAVAEAAGTIPYDVLTGIHPRLPRRLV